MAHAPYCSNDFALTASTIWDKNRSVPPANVDYKIRKVYITDNNTAIPFKSEVVIREPDKDTPILPSSPTITFPIQGIFPWFDANKGEVIDPLQLRENEKELPNYDELLDELLDE